MSFERDPPTWNRIPTKPLFAVLIAVLMVTSVFVGIIALGGTAAAAPNDASRPNAVGSQPTAGDGTVFAADSGDGASVGFGKDTLSGFGPGNPTSLDFGSVTVGTTVTKDVTIQNTGDATLSVSATDVTGADASAFTVPDGGAPFELAPGKTHDVTVKFTPGSAGDKSATLTTTANANSQQTHLSGTGIKQQSKGDNLVGPENVDFGDVYAGSLKTKTVTYTNDGDAPVTVNNLSFSDDITGAFSVVAGGANFDIAPGENHNVTVKFFPSRYGATTNATLTASTVDDGNATTKLSGTDVPLVPYGDYIDAPFSKAFGKVTVGQTADRTVTIKLERNRGRRSTVTVTQALVVGPNGKEFQVLDNPPGNDIDGENFTLAPGESRNLTVRFAPDSTGDKTAMLYTETANGYSQTTRLSGTGTATPNTQNTLRIEGTGDRAFYAFRASGGVSGTGLSGEDTVSGKSAAGAVAPGSDTYTFSGSLENLYVQRGAKVYLDGKQIDPDDYESRLSVTGNGGRTAYSFTVQDGTITDSAGLSREDSVSDSSASGAVGPGSDIYTFTGTFRGLDLDGGATLMLNGIEVPQQVFYNTVTVAGTGTRAGYAFSVSGEIKRTTGLSREDSYSGDHASGAVRNREDTYTVSGDLKNLYVQQGAKVYLNGKQIDPDNYESVLSLEGNGKYSSYGFTVQDGTITDSAGLSREDSVSDSSASGAVRSRSDEYTFTGTFRGLHLDGDATLILNGASVSKNDV